MSDLMIVDFWNREINDRVPIYYNNFFTGGYINMPSARMGCAGVLGGGYSSTPPYQNVNARAQILDWFELTGNYRVFRGILDPVLGAHGFGDFSDKGANFKVALLSPEASNYDLPGIAFGFDDFLGTRSFAAKYLVLTKVWKRWNFEASIGIGGQRIHGLFGGFNWMPWRHCDNLIRGIAFSAEYDATDYLSEKHEPHPEGRFRSSYFNYGLKYQLCDVLDFSVSRIRGCAWAWYLSAQYDFGHTKGFVPKIDDPLPYSYPCNTEPIGVVRPEQALVDDLIYSFRDQGFELLKVVLSENECGEEILHLYIYNGVYRVEPQVREQINALVSYIAPSNFSRVVVVLEGDGFPVYEYSYDMNFVRAYCADEICEYELNLVTPMRDVSWIDWDCARTIYQMGRDLCGLTVLPKTETMFGSSRGKFKYALGISVGTSGFLPLDIYYSVMFGWLPISNLHHCSDIDRLNPSQLINVHTDSIRYFQQKGVTLDECYLQKSTNWGCGFYSRLAVGYFEEEYGGIAGELLLCPIQSRWAIGCELALVRKRQLNSWLGFTNTIRKLNGFVPTYQKFHGSQYFLDVYYHWPEFNMDFKVSIGKFLANDRGIRYEISRYFQSGLRLTAWYTVTNAHDMINGQVYYDKGIELSMPLDIFFMHSSCSKWGYGMSAWLRDCGFRCATGQLLYPAIDDMRERYESCTEGGLFR